MASQIDTLFQQLQRQYSSKEYKSAVITLEKLKKDLSLQGLIVPTGSSTDVSVCRILEIGALISIELKDSDGFVRYWLQLETFYELIGETEDCDKLIGLYLLLLLSENRIAEFHIKLEGLKDRRLSRCIQYPVMLEKWLMEGSYDKVWQAMSAGEVPAEEYKHFTPTLIDTMCKEIASCSQIAYDSLPLSSARALFFLKSDSEVLEIAKAYNWTVKNGQIYFSNELCTSAVDQNKASIERVQKYAFELESIV